MSEIKLKNCPFCGGEAEIISSCFVGWDKQIICKKCGASTRYLCGVTPSQATKNAIKKWNTRKPMERIIEKLELYADDHRNFKELQRKNGNKQLETIHSNIVDAFMYSVGVVKEEGGIE